MPDYTVFGSEYCTSGIVDSEHRYKTLCYYAKGHEGPHRGFDFLVQKHITWEDVNVDKWGGSKELPSESQGL